MLFKQNSTIRLIVFLKYIFYIFFWLNKQKVLKILNICVVTLSAIGLVSTFFLLYGLAKVNTHTSRAGKKMKRKNATLVMLEWWKYIQSILSLFAQNRSPFLLPWIVIVSCTTAVDLIYAIYLLIHMVRLHYYGTS
jgi:hypothetical protein